MIKAVLFDYGNVLSHPGEPHRIASNPNLKNLEANSFASAYWHGREDYDRGSVSAAHYWEHVGNKLNRKFSAQEVDHLVAHDIKVWSILNPDMLKWVSHLKKNGITIGLISNMPLELTIAIRKESWIADFDHCTFSCEIGMVKPHRSIYEHSLLNLKLNGAESLFIDDRKENIDAANELGIHGHLFTSYENLMKSAKELNLP
ncbi:MAG: HAD family phosphatase [Cyanobacteria bacterium TGS_CYA1]|nr:HAD family phosphatase [Cyanobacteria bacterium TGS_CYA1]